MKLKEIQDLSNEDFNRLSYNELLPIVKHIQKLANQRIYRIKKSGVFSPAVESAKIMNTANADNLNLLRAEFRQTMDFLNAKTSTIRGAREFNTGVQESLNALREGRARQLNYAELSNKQKSTIWKLRETIREIDPVFFNSLDSEQRMALVGKFYRKRESFESMRQKLAEYINTINIGGSNETTSGLATKDGLL